MGKQLKKIKKRLLASGMYTTKEIKLRRIKTKVSKHKQYLKELGYVGIELHNKVMIYELDLLRKANLITEL